MSFRPLLHHPDAVRRAGRANRPAMSPTGALIVVLALAIATFGWLTPVAAAVLPCSVTWTGGAGTDRWFDGANWSGGERPRSTDVVCAAGDTDDVIVLDDPYSISVAAISTERIIEVRSGGLDLDLESRIGGLEVADGKVTVDTELDAGWLNQDGGEVTGAGSIAVGGDFTWTGGTQSGTGSTVVGTFDDEQSGGLKTDGSGNRAIAGRTIRSFGTSAWAATSPVTMVGGQLLFHAPLAAHADVEIRGTGQVRVDRSIDAPLHSVRIEPALEVWPAAIIEATGSGRTIELSGTGTRIDGRVSATEGAALAFPRGDHHVTVNGALDTGETSPMTVGGSLTVEGGIEVGGATTIDGGDLVLPNRAELGSVELRQGRLEAADGLVHLAELRQLDGEIAGAGTFAVAGNHIWSQGTQVGTGATHVAGALLLPGGETRTITDREVVTGGLVSKQSATLQVDGGAKLTLVGDSTIEDADARFEGSGVVELMGRLRLADGSLAVHVGFDTLDESEVSVEGVATLGLAGAGHHDGLITLAATGALDLDGIQDLTATGRIRGDGLVAVESSGTLSVDGSVDVGHVTTEGTVRVAAGALLAAGEITNEGSLTVGDQGIVRSRSGFDQTAGSTTLLGPDGRIEAAAPVTIRGGVLAGSGTVYGSVISGGEIRPGDRGAAEGDQGIGTLYLTGDYQQLAEGRLVTSIGNSGSDRLALGGDASLAGNLDVTVDGGADPGSRHEVLRATTRLGEFAPQTNPFCSTVEHGANSVTVLPQPCLSVRAKSVLEASGSVRIPVVLGVPTTATVTVDYVTEAVTATDGTDFEAQAGTVTIAAGAIEGEILVPIVDDEDEERTESFRVRLSDASGAEIRPADAIIAILDDDGDEGADYLVHGTGWFASYQEPQPKAMNRELLVGVNYLENLGSIAFGLRLEDNFGSILPPLGAAWDINESGVMVGSLGQNLNEERESAAYRVGGQTTPMVPLEPTSSSFARGINDAGVIVGEASSGTGAATRQVAVIWEDRDQAPTVIGPPGADESSARDVNEEGWVVGWSEFGGHRRAWVWNDGLVIFAPEVNGGAASEELAINDGNVVVGSSGDHAFMWTVGMPVVDLGLGEAVDINDDGDIVGFDTSRTDLEGAVVWRDGERIDLNTKIDSEWKLSIGEVISDDGWIAGRGVNQDGSLATFVLEPDGCSVCVVMHAEEEQYPTHEWGPIGSHTTDGNLLQIKATVVNEEVQPITGTVRLTDADTDEVIGEPDPESITLQPGEDATVSFDWDSTGSAWEEGLPAERRQFVAEFLEAGDDSPNGRGELAIKVNPRPVVLAHGLWSDASTWSSYQSFLTSVHPDWKAFVVDTMDTKSFFPKTIAENVGALASFTEDVQVQENAWRVDLVGHSMGGLISRYYIQHFMHSRDGVPAVAHLAMLGTPNGGSPCALVAPVPATVELRPGMAEAFNSEVFDAKHVELSLAYGLDRSYTCQDLFAPGDMVVPVTSVLALPYVTDTKVFPLAHTDMTGSADIFTTFVKPRLMASAGAPPPGTSPLAPGAAPGAETAAGLAPGAATLAEASPQLAFTETAEVGANESYTSTAVVPEASRLGALVVAPGSVGMDLVGPDGAVGATLPGDPADTAVTFRTLALDVPAAGQWTVVLHRSPDDGNGDVLAMPLTMWLEGTTTTLTARAAAADRDGGVRITGQVTGLGPDQRPEALDATVLDKAGVPTLVTLLDDGAHDDGSAGDGIYAGSVGPLPEGAYTVVLLADAAYLARMTATAVLVRHGDGGPGNDAPVARDATVTSGHDMNAEILLEATDVDGDPLTFVVVDPPTHGQLGGRPPMMTYTPEPGFRGTDTFTFTAADGLATSAPATVTIEIGAVPTVLDLLAPHPTEGRVTSTTEVRVKLTDARRATLDRAPVTITLDGTTVEATTGSDGVAIASLPIAADAPTGTRELVVTYAGSPDHRASALRRSFAVLPNRAPGIWATNAPFSGEAGYPTRLWASTADDDGNATTIEWDVDDDGTWDHTYTLTGREVGPIGIDHTYAAAFAGQVRMRVTDAGGLHAETVAAITIAEHRPLGRTERLIHPGELNRGDRIELGAISGDGRFVLHTVPDDVVDPADPVPHLSDLFLLDRTTGQSVVVSVLPDGTPATSPTGLDAERAAVSADGRFVAFTAGDLVTGQVYLRDLVAGTTVLASVADPAAPIPAWGPSFAAGVSADGGVVLLTTWAANIDPGAPCPLAADGSARPCSRLVAFDRATGTATVVGRTSSGAVPARVEAGSISADGRHVVFPAGDDVDGPTTGVSILAVDRTTGTVTPIVGAGPGPTTVENDHPSVSADGRLVAFASNRADLVADDGDGEMDVFVRDRDGDGDGVLDEPGTTSVTRASAPMPGRANDGLSAWPSLAADGSAVAFRSESSGLVPGDTNGYADIFVRSLRTGAIERVSVETRDGAEGDDLSSWPRINADGTVVVFASDAANLVPGDTNGVRDAFAVRLLRDDPTDPDPDPDPDPTDPDPTDPDPTVPTTAPEPTDPEPTVPDPTDPDPTLPSDPSDPSDPPDPSDPDGPADPTTTVSTRPGDPVRPTSTTGGPSSVAVGAAPRQPVGSVASAATPVAVSPRFTG